MKLKYEVKKSDIKTMNRGKGNGEFREILIEFIQSGKPIAEVDFSDYYPLSGYRLCANAFQQVIKKNFWGDKIRCIQRKPKVFLILKDKEEF